MGECILCWEQEQWSGSSPSLTIRLLEANIRLDFPDTQCNLNHSGILCGSCRPGLMQAYTGNFPVSQMLKQVCCNSCTICYCRNIAGSSYKALESHCFTRNTEWGLFFANIIGAYQVTFFPLTSMHRPVLTVFIAWLNLDLGIESCLIDEMNSY